MPEDSQRIISYMLVYHQKTSRTNNKRVISTFKFGSPHLTLNEGPKVKSDHTRIFPAHDFLYVGLPSQTSRTNNKRVISTFTFGYPRLTLKEGPKVKSDHTRRFPAHDFLYTGLPSQTSRTNKKRVISTFKFGCPHFTLKEGPKVGPKVKSDHARRFPAHDFLYVGLPSQTSRTNNKQVISTFKFGCPHLTLKEGPKVKSDHTRRFPAHDFLYVGLPSQTSRTN